MSQLHDPDPVPAGIEGPTKTRSPDADDLVLTRLFVQNRARKRWMVEQKPTLVITIVVSIAVLGAVVAIWMCGLGSVLLNDTPKDVAFNSRERSNDRGPRLPRTEPVTNSRDVRPSLQPTAFPPGSSIESGTNDAMDESVTQSKDKMGQVRWVVHRTGVAGAVIQPYKRLPDSFNKRSGIAFTQDRRYLASSDEGKIFFWNLTTLTCEKSIDIETPESAAKSEAWAAEMDTLCFLTDGKSVAGRFHSSYRNSVFLWDVFAGKMLNKAILPPGKYDIVVLAISPCGRHVICTDHLGQTLHVLDARSGELIRDIELTQPPAQLCYSPDGDYVLFVYDDLLEIRMAETFDVLSSFRINEIAPSSSRTVPITYEGRSRKVTMKTTYRFGPSALGIDGSAIAVVCVGREEGEGAWRTFDILKLIDVKTKAVSEENTSYPSNCVDSVALAPDLSLLAISFNGITLKRIVRESLLTQTKELPPATSMTIEEAGVLLRTGRLATHFGKRVSNWRMIPRGQVKAYVQLTKDDTGEFRFLKTLVCEGPNRVFFALKDQPTADFDADKLAANGGLFSGTLSATDTFDGKTMPVLTNWSVELMPGSGVSGTDEGR